MKIIAATHNKKKAAEMKRILSDIGIADVMTLDEAGITEDVEETGTTFAENALIKARAAFAATGLPSVADDSGLSVDVLGGAPGVYSARYASADGENASDEANLDKLLENMKGVPDGERTARFVSAIAFVDGVHEDICVLGKVEGIITGERRGDGGFGYDPVFFYAPYGRTFGELSDSEKNEVSHRGAALRALKNALQSRKDG